MALNSRHQKVLEAYAAQSLGERSQQEAWMAVYPKAKPASAKANACKLFKSIEGQEYLAKLNEEVVSELADMREETVLKRADEASKLRVAREDVVADIRTVIDICMGAGDSFNPNAALKGLELLGKTSGAFVERHEHSGPDGKPLAQTISVTFVEPDASTDS